MHGVRLSLEGPAAGRDRTAGHLRTLPGQRQWCFLAVVVLALLLILAGPAGAQATGTLAGFQRTGEWLLEVGGAEVPNAEIYLSELAGAYLIISSKLPAPVILLPRTSSVQTVNLMKIDRLPDGSIDLLPGAALSSQGTFEVLGDGERVRFAVDGIKAALKAKPPLLGQQRAESLAAHSPDYARGASAYAPSAPILGDLLHQRRDVRVRVFFGSWCSACKQLVPRIMKVAEALAGSRIHVEYYGLPRQIREDPLAQQVGINSVPTGIVYVDGKEIGRIVGGEWKVPELALKNLLGSVS